MTDSKRYELLVRGLLDAQLPDSVAGCSVATFHNRRLTGKSGHEHQIDVSAELTIAGVRILVLIECKYYTHRVGIDDVLEFASRIDDIGAHKGIIVTTVGFQSGAIAMAKSKGIALVTACEFVWDIVGAYEPPEACRRRLQMERQAEKQITSMVASAVGIRSLPIGAFDEVLSSNDRLHFGYYSTYRLGEFPREPRGLMVPHTAFIIHTTEDTSVPLTSAAFRKFVGLIGMAGYQRTAV